MSNKFYEVPNKEQWMRMDFLEGKKRLAEYLKKPTPTMHIFCSYCRKEIPDMVINVVEFGKKQACRTCYQKKFAKIKQRWAKFEYPPDLVPKDIEPTTNSANEQKEAEMAVAELQSEECARIKGEEKGPGPGHL